MNAKNNVRIDANAEEAAHIFGQSSSSCTYRYLVGIQVQNMKMDFNIYGTWHPVTFEKLMMKIYDFFYLAFSLNLYSITKS